MWTHDFVTRLLGAPRADVKQDMAWLENIPAADPPAGRSSLFGTHIATNKAQCPVTFLARPELPDTVRLDHGALRGRTPDAIYTKDPPLSRRILQNRVHPRARAWSLFHHRAFAYSVPRDLITYVDAGDPMVAKLRKAYIEGLSEALTRHRDEIAAHLDRWVDRAANGRVEVTRATRGVNAEVIHLLVFGTWPREPFFAMGYQRVDALIREPRQRLAHLTWPVLDRLPTPYAAWHNVIGRIFAITSRVYFKRYCTRADSLLGRLHRQGVAEGDSEFGWGAQAALLNGGAAILPFPMVMMLHELADRPALQQRVVDEDLYAAVVKETLRLHPAVPTPARVIKEPVAGESASFQTMASNEGSVFINLKAIHRHPRGWSRPDEFIIDRWLPGWTGDGDSDYRVYAPFGLGPRTCVSAAVSPKLLEMFLRAVLSRRVVSNPSGRPPRLAEGTLGMVRYPFMLEFTERQPSPARRQPEAGRANHD